VFAKLFGSAVCGVPLVDVICCLREEIIVSINVCDAKGSIGGVLWGRDVLGCSSIRYF